MSPPEPTAIIDPSTPSLRVPSLLLRFSRVGALIVAALGGVVLLGWCIDIALFKSVLPGLPTMKGNTAAGFFCAGLSLWLLQSGPVAPRRLWFARGLALLVAVLGALSLGEDLFAIDLGIDQGLFRDLTSKALHPGRMSSATAVNFILLGLALLSLSDRVSRRFAWAYWLALPALLISVLDLVGYAFGIASLLAVVPFASMAVHTTHAFCLLSLGVLAADPARKFVRVLVSDTSGGVVARNVLPVIPLLLVALGRLALAGEATGWYDAHFALALMVFLSIWLCTFVVAGNALRLYRVDLKRQQAEQEVFALNAGLEERVRERTRELEQALVEVKQLSGLLPICSWCKKIRDGDNKWETVEHYVSTHTEATFSHGICPDCFAKFRAQV